MSRGRDVRLYLQACEFRAAALPDAGLALSLRHEYDRRYGIMEGMSTMEGREMIGGMNTIEGMETTEDMLKGKSILIADDDARNLYALSRYLEAMVPGMI